MTSVQVFGLQRAGTNYLHWVLSRNTPAAVVRNGGWKHAFPGERTVGSHGDDHRDEPVVARCRRLGIVPVVIRKDFDHWHDSIHRLKKDYRRGSDFPAVWEAFHSQWEDYATVVRYEDFLEDFDAALDNVADLLGIEVTGYQQPDRVPNSPSWRPAHRNRYL